MKLILRLILGIVAMLTVCVLVFPNIIGFVAMLCVAGLWGFAKNDDRWVYYDFSVIVFWPFLLAEKVRDRWLV